MRDQRDEMTPATDVGRRTEAWATVWLTAGSLIPVVGWLIGIRLAGSSHRWTTRQKLAVTLLLPGGLTGALWVVFTMGRATAYSCESGSFSETNGPDGPAIYTVRTPTTCTHSAIPASLGIAIALGALGVAIAVPLINWFALVRSSRQDSTQPLQQTGASGH